MKYLLTTLAITGLLSCSNRNEITTRLLNEKKALEDSVGRAELLEDIYKRRSMEEISAHTDTIKMYALQDTSIMYLNQRLDLTVRLKAINFSLDSLSKMK